MNLALAALAVGAVAGGVVAVSARDARISIVGLAVALGFAPLVADPFPSWLVLLARLVAAMLTAYLLWIVARDGFDIRHDRLRSPVEILIAAAAGLAGLSSAALAPPPVTEIAAVGLPVARGAAFAVAALSIIPILEGRDSLRLGTGLLLAVLATTLLQQGMGASVAPLGNLAFAAVMVGVAATSAGLGVLAMRASERSDRPVRAGAHPLAQATDARTQVRAGALTAQAAVLRGLARARRSDRVTAMSTRSRVAVSRVRSAQLGERTVGEVRRRFERPAGAEPEVEPEVESQVEPQVVEPPESAAQIAIPAEPEKTALTQTPSSITARSAGARRSLPRHE